MILIITISGTFSGSATLSFLSDSRLKAEAEAESEAEAEAESEAEAEAEADAEAASSAAFHSSTALPTT